MTDRHGATPEQWDHFALAHDLVDDLLPVVSNPNAQISPHSKMKAIGKTPSLYTRDRMVAGIPNWTQKRSTLAEVTKWRSESDYGICIQTRRVRALDCDIDNPVLAKNIYEEIAKYVTLPARVRSNAPKFLLAFTLAGEHPKRTIKTDHGIIEFLGNGQQFVAAGTHPSGVAYEWRGGLPEQLPELTTEQFERLWARLDECFATEPSLTSNATIRHNKIEEAVHNDPVAKTLIDKGLALSTERDGRVHIVCPFSAEHTTDSAESATTYFPAFTGGFERGHFRCLHAHCTGRADSEFLSALGVNPVEDDFDIVPADSGEVSAEPIDGDASHKYVFEHYETSVNEPPPEWIIKGVLPRAALSVIFGESGSGKTFLSLDMAGSIARGVEWRGKRTRAGPVAYVAAEDAHGVRMRVKAYVLHNAIQPGEMQLDILAAAPDFTKADDVKEVIKALQRTGPYSVVIVDTLAQVTAGSDENSAEDMGRLLKHCAQVHKHTKASVVLIHHSGKDASKGARGHSSLRGAADCMVEVSRSEHDRTATVYKLKNGQDGEEFGLRLFPVEVGTDEDGETVTSCVIEHVAATPKSARKVAEPRGSVEKLVLRVANEMAIGGTVAVSALIPAVTDLMPFDSAEGKRDKRREHVLRALSSLRDRGAVVVEGNNIVMKGAQE